jgi:hypothetical protein
VLDKFMSDLKKRPKSEIQEIMKSPRLGAGVGKIKQKEPDNTPEATPVRSDLNRINSQTTWDIDEKLEIPNEDVSRNKVGTTRIGNVQEMRENIRNNKRNSGDVDDSLEVNVGEGGGEGEGVDGDKENLKGYENEVNQFIKNQHEMNGAGVVIKRSEKIGLIGKKGSHD